MKGFFSRRYVTGIAGVLGTLVAVNEYCHVPCLLIAQTIGFSQGHIRFDKTGGGVDAMHACTPVERIFPPQRREDISAFGLSALAIGSVAKDALGDIDLSPTFDVGCFCGFIELGISPAR